MVKKLITSTTGLSIPVMLFGSACLVLGLTVSCGREEPVKGEQSQPSEGTTTAEFQRIRQEVLALANRHDADYQWKVSADACFFTAELEDILHSVIGRPLLTSAPIADVQKQEGHYLLVVDDVLSVSNLFLRLKCSPSQAEYVMNIAKDGGYYGWFAIAFTPETVYRPVWQLKAQPDGDSAYIKVQEAGAWFVKGACLDLSYVGQDEIDVADMVGAREHDQ